MFRLFLLAGIIPVPYNLVMPKPPALAKFQKLIDDISTLYLNAQKAYVQFAWETGRRIVEVEQDGAVRAAYGVELIPKISAELTRKFGAGFSETTLEKMRQFYLQRPISPISGKLDWSDHVELLPIKDEKTRRLLEKRILKEDLNSLEIRKLVKTIRHIPTPKEISKLPPLKRPTDLKLNTYAKSSLHVTVVPEYVLLDCGFMIARPVGKEELARVSVTATPSYTYAAFIDRVIDGDTLVVVTLVGFGNVMVDKLRLRGIDCPELGTPEGQRAKACVAGLLPVGSTIVLKSHKSRTDTHGRFVVDVFFKTAEADPEVIIKDGVYLNQHLLDEGHAVRMKE